MVSIGQSPRRLHAQGGRVGAGSPPRREAALGRPCVSAFRVLRAGSTPAFLCLKQRGGKTEKWKPEAEGRGAGSWGGSGAVSLPARVGEASPLPGAGNESRQSAEPRAALGGTRTRWASRLRPPGRGLRQTLGAGPVASRGPRGRAGPGWGGRDCGSSVKGGGAHHCLPGRPAPLGRQVPCGDTC